jgi:hypothetical protein
VAKDWCTAAQHILHVCEGVSLATRHSLQQSLVGAQEPAAAPDPWGQL